MKILKELLKLTISLTVIFTIGAYAFFLYTLPIVLTSYENIAKYEDFLSKKVSTPVSIKNLDIKTHPNLSFDITAKGIYIIPSDENSLFHADNLKYSANIFNLKHGKFSSDYIYANIGELKNKIKFENKSDSKGFNLDFYPQVDVKKAYIRLNDNVYSEFDYITSKKNHGKIITKLLAKIYTPYTKSPIILGNKGTITYKNKLRFNNFSTKIGNSEFFISGNNTGMKIKGNNLPVGELESGFLYFYKLRNPQKRNFLENFSDFKGTIDVDLLFDNKGITGKCITHNLGAKFSNLKIDVFLPKTVFDFNGREVSAETKGTFGGEPVETDFHLTGIFTKNIDVKGNVSSPFTDRITKKYYPNVEIVGVADANVTYHTQNQKVDVYYTLRVNKGNNLKSKWGNLNNTDQNRIISMHTVKEGDPMKIESWDYSIQNNNNENTKILFGDGDFKKINGRYALSDLSIKTDNKISIDYIKSFLRDYIKNGTFDADLKLGFLSKTILGSINLYEVSHKDYLYLKNTNITVDKDKIKFLTEGNFFSSPIKISASVANRLSEDILIHSIDIHLNEFFLKQGKLNDIPKTLKKAKTPKYKRKKIQYTVEQGRIIVDKLYGNKFDMRNVNIQGYLRNNVAVFVIPKSDYANGLLSAKGMYSLSEHASNIKFYASDIDSNVVMTDFFKLPDQVHGVAFATLHVITRNKLNDVKAAATFAISDGYMPQIANHEFFVGRKKDGSAKHKYTISKITNFDFSNKENITTNIYGSFNLDNDIVRDLKMFAKSQWLGLYFEGNYNIYSQAVNLKIYGKRNKTYAKGIRIFKVPLNLLYKLAFKTEHTIDQYQNKIKMIPEICASDNDIISYFRVSILGYFSRKNGLNIELKDLR